MSSTEEDIRIFENTKTLSICQIFEYCNIRKLENIKHGIMYALTSQQVVLRQNISKPGGL